MSRISSFSTKHIISSSSSNSQPNPILSESELNNGCRLGLDSHTDTSCAGKHVRVLEYVHGRECIVQPFNDSYSPIDKVNIINGALAYDTGSGETFILILNQDLDFRNSMEHSLLSVNQARHNNIAIDDVHPSIDYYNRSKYNIFFPDMNKSVKLTPTNKPISHVQVRYPTDDDLDNCHHFELTSPDDWNPNEDFPDNFIASVNTEQSNDSSNTLYNDLLSKIQISAINHTKFHKELSKETLAELWSIHIQNHTHHGKTPQKKE